MKKKPILFIIGLVIFLAVQAKVLMPVIYDIVASDFFLEDTGDEENRISTTNLLTISAYDQCNNYIENEISTENSITFTEKPINAFSLGNFQYVVNADIEIQPANAPPFTRRYACRIKYLEGTDNSGVNNSENWSVDGLTGLDDL